MKAIIVAGGKGERLKPLTNNLPKPMVKINGRPILEYIVTLFKKNGISDFIFALCYLPQSIIEYFGDGDRFGIKIKYTFENPNFPLGTAGAILRAKKLITDTFVVTYADIIRELSIKEIISFHKMSKNLATINTYKHLGDNYKSSIEFNKDNYITSFQEFQTEQKLEKGFNWSNGSFYIFEPEIFDYIPHNKKSDFSKDIFPKLLRLKKKILIYPTSGYFLDVGTKENLKKLKDDLKFSLLTLGD
ncbi:NDP-sugar synthase [Candidatus Daviesbacteria bacterium]|nr:NDP-sugar synthase [Candidatus Daviesbacteria bacterium]